MAKKNSTKDTEQSLSLFGKIRAIFKNENNQSNGLER